MIRKTLIVVLAAASLLSAAQAIPLRELIFQTMEEEHPGVLSDAEIKEARKLGALWYHQHGNDAYFDIEPLAKASARKRFPGDLPKQQEWELECSIGNMMAVEATLWEP